MAVSVRDQAALQGGDCVTCLACVEGCPAEPAAFTLRLLGRDVGRLGTVGFALAGSGIFVALSVLAASLRLDARIPF